METETTTALRPFPKAPHFDCTPLQRREYNAGMREAWLDRADDALAKAQQAQAAGDYTHADMHLLNVQTALTMARSYRQEVAL